MIGFLALRLLSPNRIAGAAPAASTVAPAAVVAVCFRKSLRFIPSSRERSSPLHLLILPFHKWCAASCRAVRKETRNSFTTSRQGTAKARRNAKARNETNTNTPRGHPEGRKGNMKSRPTEPAPIGGTERTKGDDSVAANRRELEESDARLL